MISKSPYLRQLPPIHLPTHRGDGHDQTPESTSLGHVATFRAHSCLWSRDPSPPLTTLLSLSVVFLLSPVALFLRSNFQLRALL